MHIFEYLTYNFLLVFIVYKSINTIFDKNVIYNKNIEILSYTLYYILGSFIYLINVIPIIMLLYNIISIFLIQFNYKTRVKDKVLMTMYIYLMLFILDLFVVLVLNQLTATIFTKLYNFNNFSFLSVLIELVIFIMVLSSIKSFRNMKFKVNMPKIFWVPLIIVPFMSMILLLLILNIRQFYRINIMLILIILIILNISVFLLYNYIVEALIKREEQNILEQQYFIYNKQFELMQENIENLNIIKHDAKKHLLYLNQLILNNNNKESLEYISDLLNNKDGILNEDKQIINTGNTCIDTIINLKLNEAINNNIKINHHIIIPYDLNIFTIDIICLFGNLLDNAIEASLKLKDFERYINLKVKYYNGELFINIKNKYNEILKDENGNILSTKRINEKDEGLGIKIIEKIIRKYNGSLIIKDDNNEFSLSIILNI